MSITDANNDSNQTLNLTEAGAATGNASVATPTQVQAPARKQKKLSRRGFVRFGAALAAFAPLIASLGSSPVASAFTPCEDYYVYYLDGDCVCNYDCNGVKHCSLFECYEAFDKHTNQFCFKDCNYLGSCVG